MRRLLPFLIACGGASHPETPPPGPAPSADGVKQWVREVMTAYEQADAATFDTRLDPDGLFLGTAPDEVWTTPQFLAAHHKMLGSIKPGSWHLKSDDLRAVAAPDGKSAWMSNLFEWDFGDGSGPHPLRWTAVFVQRDGKWLMSASEVSFGVPNEALAKLTAETKLGGPQPVPDAVDPEAKPMLAVFDADLASPQQWIKDISDREDAYVLGSDPTEVWAGPAAIKKAFDNDSEHRATLARAGAARAHVVPGGQLGWVIANVDVTVGAAHMPLRLLAVYLHEGGGWKMVQLHASTAIPS